MKRNAGKPDRAGTAATLAVIAGCLLWIAAALATSGCDSPVPGLRFAPKEEVKQTTRAGADLAAIAAANGLPPGSAAARRLAMAARVGADYTGPPREPINIEDLIPDAITDAWPTLKRQAQALTIQRDIRARTDDIIAAALADLLTTIQDKADIAADAVIHRVYAIAEVAKMGSDIAAAVQVPTISPLSAAEQSRLDRLDASLAKIQEAAAVQAARRPTAKEVVNKVEDAAGGIADWLETAGLLSLIPGAGGVAYALRKRKVARTAAEAVTTAEHDRHNAERNTFAANAAAQAATANALDMAKLLAAAQPANVPATPPQTDTAVQ